MSGRRISLEIVSAGLRTVLGGGCLAAAMMARAVRFTPRLTELRDARGERIRMGIVEGVPRDLLGALRLVAIAAPALVEAAGGAAAALGRREPLPVWLAMPEAGRPDDDPRLSAQVLDLLARASGVRIDLDRSGVVRAGRAGGAEVVERAAALWGGAEPAPAAVIVGGVDSAHHPALVEAIERRRAEEPGSWSGALRSEGAAFVALAPPGAAPLRRGTDEPARGGAAGAGAPRLEGAPVHVLGAATWRPDALAAPPEDVERSLSEVDFVAARIELLRRVMGERRAGWTLPDVNDDPERAVEWWEIAREAGLEGAAEDHLCERIGDAGAAIGPASMAIAWAWWKAGCGRAPAAAIALASDDGACGAIALASD